MNKGESADPGGRKRFKIAGGWEPISELIRILVR